MWRSSCTVCILFYAQCTWLAMDSLWWKLQHAVCGDGAGPGDKWDKNNPSREGHQTLQITWKTGRHIYDLRSKGSFWFYGALIFKTQHTKAWHFNSLPVPPDRHLTNFMFMDDFGTSDFAISWRLFQSRCGVPTHFQFPISILFWSILCMEILFMSHLLRRSVTRPLVCLTDCHHF